MRLASFIASAVGGILVLGPISVVAAQSRGERARAPRTSDPHPEQRVYPYLLKDMSINRSNQVWCADITYIPVRRGFLYLMAIMDWASRHVLAWRLSNTMDAGFCVEALDEALTRHGQPEVFNTDQGSQFTGFAFTGRSLKYEAVYLHELADGFEARRLIDEWIGFYNTARPHSALDGKTPAEAYRGAATATGRSIQGDLGGMSDNRNTP